MYWAEWGVELEERGRVPADEINCRLHVDLKTTYQHIHVEQKITFNVVDEINCRLHIDLQTTALTKKYINRVVEKIPPFYHYNNVVYSQQIFTTFGPQTL